jgi:hypothetical protein
VFVSIRFGGQEARTMRVAFDVRSAGYPVAIIMFLVAIYCLLVGSGWVAGALGLAGVALLAMLTRLRDVSARRTAG